jgi:uncharacterized Fe-S cluster-containing radical SAM superfamily protein
LYDPVTRSKQLESIALKGNKRKYYRFRRAKWYGGIATGDVCCCNLRCCFCWAGDEIRDHPERIGKYYSSEEAFGILRSIATKYGYKQIRLSGQEPTIGKKHLIDLMSFVDQTDFNFILETNGILIGSEPQYARDLAQFKNLHVRVSLKGTNRDEFSKLTGSIPEGFDLQLKALKYLLAEGVSFHPSVMSAFSPAQNLKEIYSSLERIEKSLAENLETEELILYPHVRKRLRNKVWREKSFEIK